MKRITTILTFLMLVCMGAWATDITVLPANGVYWKEGAVTSDAWAPVWKSNTKASDGTTPLLVFTAPTGIDTSNGDIYVHANAYILEAADGYVISSYTINGTATGGDVTITPAGESGTTISSGNSLGTALSVTAGAQKIAFTLSGSGHLESLNLVVTVVEGSTWSSGNTADATSGKLSSVGFFRLTTPDKDGLSFSSFTLKHLGDSFKSDVYLAISSTKLSYSDYLPSSIFAGISNNAASSTGVFTYTFDSPVRLLGNTQYYFYFVQRNIASGRFQGTYKLVTHGLAVQTGLSSTGFVWATTVSGDEATNNSWWPYFTCTYDCVGNSLINSKLIAITTAYKNRDASAQIGYPTSSAISSLNSAITTAGTYSSANYKALMSAFISAMKTINYTPRTDVYYTIVNADIAGSRGSMVYDPSHDASVDTKNDDSKYLWYGSSTPDDSDKNNLWGFVLRNGHYYMYNVGKCQFATIGSGTYGTTWIFSDTPSYITLDDGISDEIVAPNVRVRATIATTGDSYSMSVSNSYTGPIITYDKKYDGGVPMVFNVSETEIDDDVTTAIIDLIDDPAPYRTVLKDVLDACDLLPIGTGLNEYVSTTDYETALSAAETLYSDDDATISQLQTAASDLTSAKDGLSLNLPGAGFYRIKGNTSSKYITSGFASNDKFPMTTDTDAGTIFYYDGTKLTNLKTGMCNGVTGSGNWAWVIGSSASTVVFKDGLSNGGYAIQTGTGHFYDDGSSESSSADRGGSITISSSTDGRYTSWYLIEISTLPITISTAQYATLCSPVALTIPSGVKAYTGVVNGSYLTLSEVSTTIPANTAVVLKADPEIDANTTFNFATTTSAAFSGDNDLAGYAYAIAKTDGDLVLGNGDSGIGFYGLSGTTLAGFKAYLPAAKVAEARELKIVFEDEITGVHEVIGKKSEVRDGAYYDLQGRRVQNPQHGLYIVNGKKVVIK